jgi:hypothetical protein
LRPATTFAAKNARRHGDLSKDELVHAASVHASCEAAKFFVYMWLEERVPIPNAMELQAREAIVRVEQLVDQR